MTLRAEIEVGQLAELVKQVEAGNEVLLTQDHKAVAKLVPAFEKTPETVVPLSIHSLKGHSVLTPVISQSDIAEEMFGQS